MGVPCPGCGRQYDATLFAYGRTLHCACGSRVRMGPRVVGPATSEPPRFMVDAMLGRVARWLRILGFDTAYERDIDDEDLARRAIAEGRTVLTRDRRLPVEWDLPRCSVLRAETPFEQLAEVVRRFGLADRLRLFSRCNRCNAALVPAAREEVIEEVPARIAKTHREFRRCPSCRRVYWAGSHVERIRRIAEQLTGSS